MDGHEGNRTGRRTHCGIFKFGHTAIYKIAKEMMKQIADILFQIVGVKDLNMMQIFKLDQ